MRYGGAMSAQRVRVLDPTASGSTTEVPLAPPPIDLAGLRLGLRVDDTWPAFSVFSDELARIARRDWKITEVHTFDPGTRSDAPEVEAKRLEGFVGRIDVAVVGLGT